MSTKAAHSAWDLDIRVRERNLKNGLLAAKDVEKMLAALPDSAGEVEALGLEQPAIGSSAAHGDGS